MVYISQEAFGALKDPGGVLNGTTQAAMQALMFQIDSTLRNQFEKMGLEYTLVNDKLFRRETALNAERYYFDGMLLLSVVRVEDTATGEWKYDIFIPTL